ncbi:Crp/Fnr family transcriptional regulator [Pseudoduganella namucuonensis]|uniref:cAMP-binding domain of CRP or a regulatory subunit of cAMP-dependent protein kinases n=1 Tax=Pseudoduganella namucuonensis TaxID=1035707 RepID=A0A1I7J4N4_9BURK|nr:Crp/Fnr family transcriptional regulator [Pseudoduganella namucuonensis]SFU80156.1 cAMP-binding domain of CRP or a regulatory subunit of cAMP-dependent protein kinases [Pseudoduganella namucuonensis]
MNLTHDTAYGSSGPPPLQENRLLASLPEDDLLHLESMCEAVHMEMGDVLYEPGQAIQYIYFPSDSLISLLAVAEGRMTLEVGSVGREGMIGSSVALGHQLAQVRAVVQRAGGALRIHAADFCAEFTRMESLQRLLYRYTDTLLAQAIQIAVCSRFHVLEARLARSLLITRDRLQSEKFHLTHEFLAHALGVRRVGVTKAASALQNQKLITYSRGNIEILDSAGLEAVSCRCYEMVKDTGSIGMANVFL